MFAGYETSEVRLENVYVEVDQKPDMAKQSSVSMDNNAHYKSYTPQIENSREAQVEHAIAEIERQK